MSFLPGGVISYIVFQSRLLFLHYIPMLFLRLLKWGYGSFSHSFICCSSKYNITRLLLNVLCLDINHRIVCTGLLYLGRCNGVVCYPIGFFGLVSRRMGYGFKSGMAEWG